MAETPEATITYKVPHFKGTATLDRYGDYDGNVLLRALVTGDGPAVDQFLAELAIKHNEEYDRTDARYAFQAKVIEAIDAIVATVSLTGFKAYANTDPKTRYSRPKLTKEGEGCEAGYCDLAGKFRFPPAPEGVWKSFSLVCQKHAVEVIEARADFIAQGGKDRHIYLTSDQHRTIKDAARTSLLTVKA